MSRDIKFKFLGKATAGFNTGDVDFCSAYELEQWEAAGEYKIEVIEKPKASSKKSTSKKK